MNEKIQTLLRKSGLPALDVQNDIFLEQFAVLIIQECADIAKLNTRVDSKVNEMIKEHFGVK